MHCFSHNGLGLWPESNTIGPETCIFKFRSSALSLAPYGEPDTSQVSDQWGPREVKTVRQRGEKVSIHDLWHYHSTWSSPYCVGRVRRTKQFMLVCCTVDIWTHTSCWHSISQGSAKGMEEIVSPCEILKHVHCTLVLFFVYVNNDWRI